MVSIKKEDEYEEEYRPINYRPEIRYLYNIFENSKKENEQINKNRNELEKNLNLLLKELNISILLLLIFF